MGRGVVRLQGETPLVVEKYGRLVARKGLVQPPDDDDGEFKPLGSVHGHHADGVFAPAFGIADLAARLDLL